MAAVAERFQLALKPPFDGAQVTWLDALREGPLKGYPTPDGTGIEITAEQIKQLAQNIQRIKQPVPIDGSNLGDVLGSKPHELEENSGADAVGWILDAATVLDGNGKAHLWVQAAIQPFVALKIDAGTLLFGSSALSTQNLDPESGKSIGARLMSYAFTNKPFQPGLTPHRMGRAQPGELLIAASAEFAERIRSILMDGDKDKKTTQEPKQDDQSVKLSATVEAIAKLVDADASDPAKLVEAIKIKLAQKPEPKTDEDAANLKAQVVALEAQVVELGKYREEAEASRKQEAARIYLADKCKERGIQCDDEQKDKIIALAVEKDHSVIDTFVGAFRAMPPRGLTMASAPVKPRKFASEEEALQITLSEIKKEQPNLSETEATKAALIRLSQQNRDYGMPRVGGGKA